MTLPASPIERVPLEVPGTGPIVNCKGCYRHFVQFAALQVYCHGCIALICRMRSDGERSS